MRLSTRFFIIALVTSSYTYSNDAKKAWDSPEMGTRELSENAWVELEKYRLQVEAVNQGIKIKEQAQIALAQERHWQLGDVCAVAIPFSILGTVLLKLVGSMQNK